MSTTVGPGGIVNIGGSVEVITPPSSGAPVVVAPTGGWDTALWGGDLTAFADWQTASAIGYTFAPVIRVSTQGLQIEWLASDLVFELGDVL